MQIHDHTSTRRLIAMAMPNATWPQQGTHTHQHQDHGPPLVDVDGGDQAEVGGQQHATDGDDVKCPEAASGVRGIHDGVLKRFVKEWRYCAAARFARPVNCDETAKPLRQMPCGSAKRTRAVKAAGRIPINL
jgi:hypothetical protein